MYKIEWNSWVGGRLDLPDFLREYYHVGVALIGLIDFLGLMLGADRPGATRVLRLPIPTKVSSRL